MTGQTLVHHSRNYFTNLFNTKHLMKSITMLLTILAFFLYSNSTYAEAPSDFYTGDWKVVVTGTPNGDAEMILHLERVDGKLTGEMRDNAGNVTSVIESVDETDGSITVYYTAMGYGINLTLKKVDDLNVKGSLMGMFDAKGERILPQ